MELRLHVLKLFRENYWLLFFLDAVYKKTAKIKSISTYISVSLYIWCAILAR